MILVRVGLIAALLLPAANAFAADPSVMRVVVVPSAGQLSLVIEMTDEARQVSTEQPSATVLLLEAGPIASPLKRQVLNAPSSLALIDQVALDEGTSAGNEHILRVRMTLKRSAPSSVRVVGRRIYIDFLVPDAPMPLDRDRPHAPVAAAVPERHQPADTAPTSPFRQTLTGAASRFEEIQPFLLSATNTTPPNPVVLNAVAEAITSVQQSLSTIQAPAEGRPQLQLLASAVSLAAEAVSTGFQGDRAAKAKQSLTAFAAAKAQLQ